MRGAVGLALAVGALLMANCPSASAQQSSGQSPQAPRPQPQGQPDTVADRIERLGSIENWIQRLLVLAEGLSMADAAKSTASIGEYAASKGTENLASSAGPGVDTNGMAGAHAAMDAYRMAVTGVDFDEIDRRANAFLGSRQLPAPPPPPPIGAGNCRVGSAACPYICKLSSTEDKNGTVVNECVDASSARFKATCRGTQLVSAKKVFVLNPFGSFAGYAYTTPCEPKS